MGSLRPPFGALDLFLEDLWGHRCPTTRSFKYPNGVHSFWYPRIFLGLECLFLWLAEGWSLILAEPEPGRTRPNPNPPRRQHISELNWADIWADLSFYWSERAETFRADPNKTHDKIQIKNKMSNPSQEPPASSKAPNEDLKDMDVLCTFKIKIESQNLDHGYIKDQWPYPNLDQDANPQSGTSSVL